MNDISIREMRPYLRYVRLSTISDRLRFINYRPYDYRLFYILGGRGKITVDGGEYPVSHGDLVVFRSGLVYSLENAAGCELELLAINFDLSFLNSHIDVPIPPLHESLFRENEILEPERSPIEVIYQPRRTDLEPTLLSILSHHREKRRLHEHRTSGMLLALLSDVLAREEELEPRASDRVLDRILEVIRSSYREPLSNEDIGRAVGYHPNHVNRIMIASTGVSLHRYLTDYRLDRAMDLLQGGKMTVSEIAEEVGFSNLAHFSKAFKKKTGRAPREFAIYVSHNDGKEGK